MMSNPRLPAEILDHVVDHLYDAEDTLKNCCLVSKSWVPRTRKHLFTRIALRTEQNLQTWKETFPDPSVSPARYTKSLLVRCSYAITAEDAEPGGWITGFSRVVHLEITPDTTDNLVPLQGFSRTIKSLRLRTTHLLSSQSFDLILSFPLLEDLTVITYYYKMLTHEADGSDGPRAVVQLSRSPVFTGSLELCRREGIVSIARLLLSLPGGIHFRELKLEWWRHGDVTITTALVEGCSHTLESVEISCSLFLELGESASVDLSKATKLRGAVFRAGESNVEWITSALQTITTKQRYFRQISIRVPYELTDVDVGTDVHLKQTVGATNYGKWSALDRLLVQFWESRSIRPTVIHAMPVEAERGMCVRDRIRCLLPEVMGRGVVDLVESQIW